MYFVCKLDNGLSTNNKYCDPASPLRVGFRPFKGTTIPLQLDYILFLELLFPYRSFQTISAYVYLWDIHVLQRSVFTYFGFNHVLKISFQKGFMTRRTF